MKNETVFKVTDYIEHDLEFEKAECKKLDVQFSYYQLKNANTGTIIQKVRDADILLVNMAKITSDVVSSIHNVKVILRHGIGYDNVDVDAATESGIIFANEATASSVDVAEHAIMLMFAAYRKINIHREIMENSIGREQYDYSTIHPLYRMEGKTLGIVGCGNIGSIVLKKMKSFGMKTLVVCDPYISKKTLFELGIRCSSLKDVLEQSDIITIHVPLTDETSGMFNSDLFQRMKKSAVIINTSRGPVINTADLINALREGIIAGAGLDVLSNEPPPRDSELVKMKNVVLTPHLGWYSEEGGWDIRHMIMNDLRAFLQGKPPRYVINSEVYKNPKLRMKLSV